MDQKLLKQRFKEDTEPYKQFTPWERTPHFVLLVRKHSEEISAFVFPKDTFSVVNQEFVSSKQIRYLTVQLCLFHAKA